MRCHPEVQAVDHFGIMCRSFTQLRFYRNIGNSFTCLHRSAGSILACLAFCDLDLAQMNYRYIQYVKRRWITYCFCWNLCLLNIDGRKQVLYNESTVIFTRCICSFNQQELYGKQSLWTAALRRLNKQWIPASISDTDADEIHQHEIWYRAFRIYNSSLWGKAYVTS